MSEQLPQLLAETPEWLVLSKPAGWLSIPGRSHGADPAPPVLSEWVRREYQTDQIWTVHRLDRETSGVILFARTAEAHRKAGIWFQKHEVKKLYLCLAEGFPAMPVLKIKVPIDGAPSASQIEVKEKYNGAFLAQVRPLTGRRHQIRIHLSSQGFPLLGDLKYKGPRTLEFKRGTLMISRVALHALRLELPSGEKFEAPWPDDFLSWVEELRNEAESDES